jgi:hypothetical protein
MSRQKKVPVVYTGTFFLGLEYILFHNDLTASDAHFAVETIEIETGRKTLALEFEIAAGDICKYSNLFTCSIQNLQCHRILTVLTEIEAYFLSKDLG